MKFQREDRVQIPDDGWGKVAVGTVVGVHPETVYVERFDGAVAAFGPNQINPVEESTEEG